MPTDTANEGLELALRDSVNRVDKIVQEELTYLLSSARRGAHTSPADAVTLDTVPHGQRHLLADLASSVLAVYREAGQRLLAHAALPFSNSDTHPRLGDHAAPVIASDALHSSQENASQSAPGKLSSTRAPMESHAAPQPSSADARAPAPAPAADLLDALLQMEPASSSSNGSSASQSLATFTNSNGLPIAMAPATGASQQQLQQVDTPLSGRLLQHEGVAENDGIIFSLPLDHAAGSAVGAAQLHVSHTSSGWGSQYLPRLSQGTLLGGMAGLTVGGYGSTQPSNQANKSGASSSANSGPLPHVAAGSAQGTATSASGLLGRLVAQSNATSSLLRNMQAAVMNGSGSLQVAADEAQHQQLQLGGTGSSSGAALVLGLPSRLQQQQPQDPAPQDQVARVRLQQHQQHQALLHQLLAQQHQAEPQLIHSDALDASSTPLPSLKQQHQQAYAYQVDLAGNVVAVMASAGGQDMYQQQQQQQALLVDGTLVLEGSDAQQFLPDASFSLFDPSGGNAMFAQQQQQQRLAASMAACGSSQPLEQLHADLQQHQHQQQQLSAALLAAHQHGQQQQQQARHSQQALSSLAALHVAQAGSANSEPLPMLVSIPTGQGTMALTFAAPGAPQLHPHVHSEMQLATAHKLLPHGLALAHTTAGTHTLVPTGHRLAGALSTPTSPLPACTGGAALLAMPGGPLQGLHGLPTHTSLTALGLGGVVPLPTSMAEMPSRFKVLPLAVQQRILALCRCNPVITIRDFDDKVVSKMCLLVDGYGGEEALAMLNHLEYRMRTKQGAMKNGPGYLDVAVCSHLDQLKAQGACPKDMKLDEYAQRVLAPPVFHELCEAVNGNRWLAWEHFDQGIIQLLKRLPPESAVEKLQEITYHSFKNVDNVKGCIMSILNSKIREDRRRP